MDSEQRIQEIYKKLKIPPNLQRHMLRAAAAAELVMDNWSGPPVHKGRVLRVLLLHDVGNIVKSDFENQPEMLEEELPNAEYWKTVQSEYVQRYGTNDHQASHEIACSLGLLDDELQLMDSKVFVNNESILQSQDYDLKISAYVDQRVGPFGVLPLMERLEEARERYRNKAGSSMNNPRTDFLIRCAADIEEQVMRFCNIAPEEINDKTIAERMESLRNFPFHVTNEK